MKTRKFAAIDIGSNGVRLLINNVIEIAGMPSQFQKASLMRMPIRLGKDVFLNGIISEINANRLEQAMNAYKSIMSVYGVEHYRACATSAMRTAKNGKAVTEKIYKNTGINIEIIDGDKEATIVGGNHLENLLKKNKYYLYVDVGGGSTETTLYKGGQKEFSHSFEIGTIRLLENMVSKDTWNEVKTWVKQACKDKNITLVGSGGNINKVFKLSSKKEGEPLSYNQMLKIDNKLKLLSYEDKIVQLKMNEDRADVIHHAMKIYVKMMKWSNSKSILVPKIGLTDGIIKSLYNDITTNTK